MAIGNRMRKLLKILSVVCILIWLMGCGDFAQNADEVVSEAQLLETESSSEVICSESLPGEEYEEILSSEETEDKYPNNGTEAIDDTATETTREDEDSIGIKADEDKMENSSFWIRFIDVGQGDSALIQCDGSYMLIDGGDNKQSSRIYSILEQGEISKLDYIIATHPDADHIGGLSGALNYATVDICFCPVTEHDTKTFDNLVKYLNKQNKEIIVPKAGDIYKLGSATVTILAPIINSSESNNNSIVTMIKYGNNSFVFTGDAEDVEEYSILSRGYDIKCDLLKVGHHGSRYSTSDYFLAACRPQYAVISVGKDNEYGHPTKEVLDKLTAIGTEIYRTDLQGDILVSSDGTDIQVTCEKEVEKEKILVAPTVDTKEGGAPDEAPDGSGAQDKSVSNDTDNPQPEGNNYVLNINTKRFHYPTCDSVNEMKAKNRRYVTMSREEIIADGYAPCKRCNP